MKQRDPKSWQVGSLTVRERPDLRAVDVFNARSERVLTFIGPMMRTNAMSFARKAQ